MASSTFQPVAISRQGLSALVLVLMLGMCGKGFAAGEVDQSSYEAEDFEVQEEGVLFDIPRTGLLYRRNLYINDDNLTFVSQQPTVHNDTTEAKPWMVYVSHWEVAPPSAINLFVRDDTTYQDKSTLIDVQIRIGQADRAGNMVAANTAIYRDIPIEKGITMVPLPIHNYPGDIISIFILGVRQRLAYQAIEY